MWMFYFFSLIDIFTLICSVCGFVISVCFAFGYTTASVIYYVCRLFILFLLIYVFFELTYIYYRSLSLYIFRCIEVKCFFFCYLPYTNVSRVLAFDRDLCKIYLILLIETNREKIHYLNN